MIFFGSFGGFVKAAIEDQSPLNRSPLSEGQSSIKLSPLPEDQPVLNSSFLPEDQGSLNLLPFTKQGQFYIDFMKVVCEGNLDDIQACCGWNNDCYFLKEEGTGDTALIKAVKCNNCNVVNFLLKYPALNIDVKNKEGKTALDLAVSNGSYNIINLLLAKRKSCGYSPKKTEYTDPFGS